MPEENKPYAESSSKGARQFTNGHALRENKADGTLDKSQSGDGNGSLFSNHGGKLAVGVAAMLGLAIYYKWREQEVSHEDPDESAGLKKIKEIVESDRPASPPARPAL